MTVILFIFVPATGSYCTGLATWPVSANVGFSWTNIVHWCKFYKPGSSGNTFCFCVILSAAKHPVKQCRSRFPVPRNEKMPKTKRLQRITGLIFRWKAEPTFSNFFKKIVNLIPLTKLNSNKPTY